MADDGVITGDLNNPADAEKFHAWAITEMMAMRNKIIWEDRTLGGMGFRIDGKSVYMSTSACLSFASYMEVNGVDMELRRIRPGEMN